MKNWMSLIAGSLLVCACASSAQADAEAEKYVDDALPLMYHTCASVVEESDGKTEYVDKVIRSLLAVSLYNREIEISKFAETDADKNKLQEKFAAALGEGCKKDNNALLAGVIDDAVVETLALK